MAKNKEDGTDCFLYNGNIEPGDDYEFIQKVSEEQKSNHCVLLLVTSGGSPHAAYKIGKYLQNRYESFTVLVSGLCKSAGTLLAIAAQEIVFTPYGELGPLDVQMPREDKLFGLESGLNISEAIRSLEERAMETYHGLIADILTNSSGVVSFHTASHAAREIVSGLYGPILGKIDPEELGSRTRAMRIGEDYGERLDLRWENLRGNALKRLSQTYSSHEFVIDRQEAESLFNRVRMANDAEMKFVEELGPRQARFPVRSKIVEYFENPFNPPSAKGRTVDEHGNATSKG